MKRELIFMFACIVSVMTTVVSCRNPIFSYYSIFYYTFDEYVDENGDGLLDLDSMIEIETFEFRGTKSEQTTPYM